jgi:hypothetical protein
LHFVALAVWLVAFVGEAELVRDLLKGPATSPFSEEATLLDRADAAIVPRTRCLNMEIDDLIRAKNAK